MKFCMYDWEPIEEKRWCNVDCSGYKVLVAMCQCKNCGRKEMRKFEGMFSSQLFKKG